MLHAYLLFGILSIALLLFIWGRWRYDIVAFLALMIAVVCGVVPYDQAFAGLNNPAVITVACVMVISQAIAQSGIVDYAVKKLAPITNHSALHIGGLSLITGLLSAFMNNVGALALMLPIAIRTAIANKRSPSIVLMPLAFASVLGGLLTAIGTPPNLLIAAYRLKITGQSFAMFDFMPVGIMVALVGIAFIALIGWRLLPSSKAPNQKEDLFQIEDYMTEVKIPEKSPMIGKTREEFEKFIEGNVALIGLIRAKRRRLTLPASEELKCNDILIIEASHNDLEKLLQAGKLELVTGAKVSSELLRSENIGLIEAVVPQGSKIEGRSSSSMRLRSRFNLNLLALARQGRPIKARLNQASLRAGDVILLQGNAEDLQETVVNLGLLPLVERGVSVGLTRAMLLPVVLFGASIALAALQILPVQIAFALAVLLLVLLRIIPVRKIYDSIDWPIIILLAAMIPLGSALASTGGTNLIVNALLHLHTYITSVVILIIFMLVTMTLSDIMNNAATAVIMAPIAASLANGLHVNIDTFLMAVAVSASCSFLTPISHQNNTLVMGPGGYKFFDYIRLGLPLEIIVLCVSVPALLWIWPL